MKPPSKSNDRIALALPSRSDAVTIVWASGERTQALVAARDQESLLVTPVIRSGRVLDENALDRLLLEFTSSGARIRLQGAVTLEDRQTLRFRDLRAVEVIQERNYVRVPASGPAIVSGPTDERPVHTYYLELGGGGMRLAGPDTLKIDEQVQFRLSISKGELQISGTGTVVRVDEGHPAICFDEISEGDHRRLMRFIFEFERTRRRRELARSDVNGG